MPEITKCGACDGSGTVPTKCTHCDGRGSVYPTGEIDRLRALFGEIADMEGVDGMTDTKFAERVLEIAIANEGVSRASSGDDPTPSANIGLAAYNLYATELRKNREIVVTNARCHSKDTVGCERHDAFAMISITNDADGRIRDIFFRDRETLEFLRNEINGVLKR